MASPSYLERKFKDLNCMKNNRMYGSLESLDSVESPPKKKKQFNLFRGLGKKSKASKSDQFSVSYDHVLEHENADERSRLLESTPAGKKRYTNFDDNSVFAENGKKGKKSKKSVKFSTVETSETGAGASSRDKKAKKKKSLLKRTGKLIVRTCRLMSYGTPYMTHMSADFPYNNRYPPDYRYYDFETKQYDFGYSNNYMGHNGYSPSVFF